MNNNETQLESGDSFPASHGYAYAVLKLTDLRIVKCADRDALHDALIAFKQRQISTIALRWHVGAQTWTAMEMCE